MIVFNQMVGSETRVVMCCSMDEAPTTLCSAQEAFCRCLYTLYLKMVGSKTRVVTCHSMDEAPTKQCPAQEAFCRCLYTLSLKRTVLKGASTLPGCWCPLNRLGLC